MSRIILYLSIFLFCGFTFAEEPMREWTSADGKKVQARFIEKFGSNIRIKNTNGQEFTVPLSRFSRGDQLYADEASKRLFSNYHTLSIMIAI